MADAATTSASKAASSGAKLGFWKKAGKMGCSPKGMGVMAAIHLAMDGKDIHAAFKDNSKAGWKQVGKSTAVAGASAVGYAGGMAAGAILGAKIGGLAGTVVPGLGNVVGIVLGCVVGGLAGLGAKLLVGKNYLEEKQDQKNAELKGDIEKTMGASTDKLIEQAATTGTDSEEFTKLLTERKKSVQLYNKESKQGKFKEITKEDIEEVIALSQQAEQLAINEETKNAIIKQIEEKMTAMTSLHQDNPQINQTAEQPERSEFVAFLDSLIQQRRNPFATEQLGNLEQRENLFARESNQQALDTPAYKLFAQNNSTQPMKFRRNPHKYLFNTAGYGY